MFELTEILIVLATIIVAIFYSSDGHGGASGYMAVVDLLAVSPTVTRPTALVLRFDLGKFSFQFADAATHFGNRFIAGGRELSSHVKQKSPS